MFLANTPEGLIKCKECTKENAKIEISQSREKTTEEYLKKGRDIRSDQAWKMINWLLKLKENRDKP